MAIALLIYGLAENLVSQFFREGHAHGHTHGQNQKKIGKNEDEVCP